MNIIKIYQYREIGEGDWERCFTVDAFFYYERSVEYDTRVIYG